MAILIIIAGLMVGSFFGAYTYRWGKGISVVKGRSFCPKCKGKIALYDNVPLLSFLLLKGRCRKCKKKISSRYPIIESLTAFVFFLVYQVNNLCALDAIESFYCTWEKVFGIWTLPYLLIISCLLLAILIIDFEQQIIPDELVFMLLGFSFLGVVAADLNDIYLRLLTGFGMGLFLMLLHFITRGKGMGLGDVKLVLFSGLLMGWKMALLWLSVSFIIGASIGLVLIGLKKAQFGKQIAFGPFLIVSVFVVMVFGETIMRFLFPYL